MKRSLKAALLSGLIFPGIGHIFLQKYFRGAVLVLLSLAALSGIVATAYQHALPIVDQILNGDIPMESRAIAQAAADSASATDSMVETAKAIFLVACWLTGIVDSYRIGVSQLQPEE